MRSARTIPTASRSRSTRTPTGHPLDGIPFHPYYTVKDLVGVAGFLLLFCGVIFFAPTFGGLFLESPNFEPANAAADAAAHRAGVVFHAVLRHVARGALVRRHAGVGRAGDGRLDRRCCSSCRGWIARRCARSATAARSTRSCWRIFVVSFIALAICGLKPPSGIYPMLAKVCTVLYFAFFLLMPWYTKFDSVKPVPERVTGHA